MAQFEFQIDPEGLRQMAATMGDAINELADNIADGSRERAPVVSGMLRDSVGVKKDYGKGVALVIADAPHAGLVHNGTSSGPGHPFTTKANPFVRDSARANFENLRERTE